MTPVCMSGAGVADPNDNRDELNLAVAGALECSWFVGFATSPSTSRRWRWLTDAELTVVRMDRCKIVCGR